jgi:hypothetical protein
LRDECLDNLLLGLALGEEVVNLAEFSLGAVARARKGASRMCAATRGHVAAFAHALDVPADLLGTSGLSRDACSPEWCDRNREKGKNKRDSF